MKTFSIELTEEEATRIVFALGIYTGETLRDNVEAGKKMFQQNGAIVEKITKAKNAD